MFITTSAGCPVGRNSPEIGKFIPLYRVSVTVAPKGVQREYFINDLFCLTIPISGKQKYMETFCCIKWYMSCE